MSLQNDLGKLILENIPPEYDNQVNFTNTSEVGLPVQDYNPEQEFDFFVNHNPLPIDRGVKIDYQFQDQHGQTQHNSILILYTGSGAG